MSEIDDSNREMIEEANVFIKCHVNENHVALMKNGEKFDAKNLVFTIPTNTEIFYHHVPFDTIEKLEYKKNHRVKIYFKNGNLSWINLDNVLDVFLDIDEKKWQETFDDDKKHKKAADKAYQ